MDNEEDGEEMRKRKRWLSEQRKSGSHSSSEYMYSMTRGSPIRAYFLLFLPSPVTSSSKQNTIETM